MEKEKKDLYVYGYGMSLIIPYLICFHSYKLGFSAVSVLILLAGFSGVLWVTTKTSELTPKANAWIFLVLIFTAFRIFQSHPTPLPMLFFCIAAAFLITTILNVDQLAPVYKVWMKGGHAISHVLTAVILGLMYYLVFTPVALFLKMAKKDYLTRALDPKADSYWIKREIKEFKQEHYTKQF
ncbi:MAG: SxtJ family membrane protein [Candidatus Omnitrophota bacterium]